MQRMPQEARDIDDSIPSRAGSNIDSKFARSMTPRQFFSLALPRLEDCRRLGRNPRDNETKEAALLSRSNKNAQVSRYTLDINLERDKRVVVTSDTTDR